jgi:HAD superfamily, subfamily IIIB (Acid phosphatase)
VFDIDETAPSNWEVIKPNDFGRFINGPCNLPDACGWQAWDLTALSTVIQPTLDTFNMSKSLILAPVGAQFESAADFKAPQRAAIEAEGYTIVANVGDQPSDLAGGHSERTFLLPDPFYRIP